MRIEQPEEQFRRRKFSVIALKMPILYGEENTQQRNGCSELKFSRERGMWARMRDLGIIVRCRVIQSIDGNEFIKRNYGKRYSRARVT